MLGDVASRPYSGGRKDKNLATSPTGYKANLSYKEIDTTLRHVSDFGSPLTETIEEMIEEHGDELRGDTEWEATDKDLTDARKPYDTEDTQDYLFSLMFLLHPFEPVIPEPESKKTYPMISKDYEDYEPEEITLN